MESKVITVRFNEFDQEFFDLAKQIMAEDKDFYNIDNSLVIKLAIRKYLTKQIFGDNKLNDKYFKIWSDIQSRERKYLLGK